MVHNFFQFIDFLHLNIDNFNQNSNIYIGMGNCKGKKKLYQENTSRKKIKSTQKSQNITLDMINGNNLSLVINEEEYIRIVKEFKSQKSTSITGKIKSLFIFIGFLHSNIANFKTYESILKKTEELRKTYNSLGPINNYKDRIYENKLMEKLRSKDRIIMDNISIPIRDIAAYLDIYDLSLKSNVWNWCISEIKELHENVIEEDVPIIQKYGQMYTEYRETVNNDYGWTHFFKDLDKTLDYLFSFYNDNNTTVIVAEKPSDSNTKETLQLKPLFNFIDFLHANIDNFNQYDNTILELNKMRERFFQLGFHFTEIREKRALQKEINEKWDVIFKNIVNPIKEKVAELELFDWSAPETLSNNYFHTANTLSKTYDEKDLDAILKAKRQYIEFTNGISPNVIKQAERMFEYLYDTMVEIAKNFEEKGDMPIKHEKVKRVDTFQELIEGFKAGEKVSMPFMPSNLNLPQSGAEKEAKPESNIISINEERKNMTEQQIYSKINELTTKEYEEKYYLNGYNESTLTTLDPKIIHLTFSDIHYELNEAFELIYLRGEFDFLERIKAILNIDLKTINDLYEAREWLPECTYELDFEEFIEREKSFELIYNCKTQYIQKLIDKLNEYASVSERNKVQQTIESETIAQSALSSSDNIDPINDNTNPPSLDIPLTDDELKKHFYELVTSESRILHYKTDYHHFAYAISGRALPIENQPYEVIKLTDYNNRFYYYLNDEIVQAQLTRPQKCLPNQYRKKAKELFINKNGKPLKLSNPT